MTDSIHPQPDHDPANELPSGQSSYPFVRKVKAGGFRYGPVSVTLIAACIIVALYSAIGSNTERLLPLFISFTPAGAPAGILPEVRHGEIWRLITPIFIHFGLLHIIFNMIWLKDIGSAIEHRDGSSRATVLIIFLALCSNVGQYFVGGPFFGGMSGVVYGLFGYVWLRGVLDRASGYYVPNQTVLIMLAWFVMCLVGIIPHVANAAHGFGLVAGALCGFIATNLTPRSGGQSTIAEV